MRVFQIPDLKEIPAEQQRLLGHTICTSLKEAQAKIEAFWTSSLSS
jgi:hypothetical protein